MTLANQDFGTDPASPLVRGDTIRLPFTATGITVPDVSSAEWRMADRTPIESGIQTLVTKTSGSGAITFVANLTAGVDFTVLLDPVDTQNQAPGDYYHELEVTLTSGDVQTEATGTVRLAGDVVP